jgi:hypothetical protein
MVTRAILHSRKPAHFKNLLRYALATILGYDGQVANQSAAAIVAAKQAPTMAPAQMAAWLKPGLRRNSG